MSAAPLPPPRRSPVRTLAWVLGGLVALSLAAWGALVVLFPPARLRALVEAQAARSLTRPVRFEGASLGLFPPVRLTVHKPALAEQGGFGRGAAFEAASVHMDLDVLALLGRKLKVRRLVIDRPAIHLIVAADGHNNFEDIVRESTTPSRKAEPIDLSIDELTIRRGRLLMDDLATRKRSTVTVDTKLSLDVGRGGQRIATAGTTTLSGYAFGPTSATSLSQLNTSLAGLSPSIEHRGVYDAERKRLALDRLTLVLGETELTARGVVDDPGPAARFDLTARGQGVDFGQIIDAVSDADARALNGLSGSGRMNFDLALRGGVAPKARRVVTGVVTVKDASFRYPGAPAGVEALSFTARFAPDSLGIGDLLARVAKQPVRAVVVVRRFDDPLVDVTVRGNVDLAAVAPMLVPKDTQLTGTTALDIRGRGRARDPGAMDLSGTARLTNVSVQSPQLPKKLEQVQGTVSFSQTRARVTGLQVRAGESSVAIDADVARPLALLQPIGKVPPAQVTFALRSPRLDVAEFAPKGSGPLLVPNATGGGSVAIERLINEKLDVKQVRADVTLEPGIIQARTFTLQAYGGSLAGEARIDLRDPAKPGVTLKSQATGVGADALLSTWTPLHNVLLGTLDGSVDLALAGSAPAQMLQTLTAVGLARMTHGQIGPVKALEEIARVVKVPGLNRLKFDARQLPFRVERGRVVTDQVELDGPTGKWRIAGAIGFDGALDYAASITLPASVAQSLGAGSALAAGALTDAQGNMLLDLRVTGPARAPRVTIDTGAMRDRVAGKVSQALQDQQNKLEQQARDAAETQRRAAEDSLRRVVERARQAARDSLRRKAGGLLDDFFGGGAKDTTTKP